MTVFDENAPAATTTAPAATTNTPDPASPLGDLVGEGKKFATVEDLAKGKAEADQFIEQLKSEMTGLREDLDKRLTSEQVLEEINRRQPAQNEGNTSPQISTEDISDLVKRELTGLETSKTIEGNVSTANNRMVELYGQDKAADAVAKKASELGVNVDFLRDVAAKSPTSFFELMGVDKGTQGVPQSTGDGLNTEGLSQSSPAIQGGTVEAYSELRKTNPKEYWSPDVQKKLFELKKTEIASRT